MSASESKNRCWSTWRWTIDIKWRTPTPVMKITKST
jgi:hypothetical protein